MSAQAALAAWWGCHGGTGNAHDCGFRPLLTQQASYEDALAGSEDRDFPNRFWQLAEAGHESADEITTPRLAMQAAQLVQPCTQLITLRLGCRNVAVSADSPSKVAAHAGKPNSCRSGLALRVKLSMITLSQA